MNHKSINEHSASAALPLHTMIRRRALHRPVTSASSHCSLRVPAIHSHNSSFTHQNHSQPQNITTQAFASSNQDCLLHLSPPSYTSECSTPLHLLVNICTVDGACTHLALVFRLHMPNRIPSGHHALHSHAVHLTNLPSSRTLNI
jgi:hypothetical protein